MSEFHIRKLVKSGHASLVLAVPSDWVKRNKLKAGDLLHITENLNNLLITTELKDEPAERKEIVINTEDKMPETVVHEITAAYLANYHRIIVKGKDLSRVLKSVKRIISDLVALELMEESSEKIIARSFLNLYDVDLKAIVRRMDNIIRSMIIDVKTASKKQEAENIINRDEEVNRLSFLVFRILKVAYANKKVMKSVKLEDLDVLKYWELTMHLEKLGDRAKYIAEIILDLDPSHRKKCLELLESIEKLYLEVMSAFYKASFEMADSISMKRKTVLEQIRKYVKKSDCATCSQVAIYLYTMTANINDISRIVRYLNE